MVKVRIDSKLKDMSAEAFLELAKEINESSLEELNLKPNLPKYVIRAAYNRNKKTREIGKNLSFLLDLSKEKRENIKIYDDQYKSEKFNSILNDKKYSSDSRKKLSQFVDRKVILEQSRLSRIWKPSYVFALFLATVMGIGFMPAKYAYDSTEEAIKNHKTKQEFMRYVEAKENLQDFIEENEIIQIRTQKEIENLEKAIVDKKASKFFCICPLDSINKDHITGARAFGWRIHPVHRTATGGPIQKHHDGIDMGIKYGKKIFAVKKGKVMKVGYNKEGYGWYVDIEHEGRWMTKYGHLRKDPKLKVGEELEEEEFIGYVGSTGVSTSAHLHFEIRKKVKNKWHPTNPLPLIKTKEELKYLNKDITFLEAQADSQQTQYSSLISSKDSLEKEILQEHARHDSIGDYINNANMLKLIF